MSFYNYITPSPERLQGLGIQDPTQAQKNIELLRSTLGAKGFPEFMTTLLPLLSSTADPDMALNNLERFLGSLGDAPSFLSVCRTRPGILVSLVTIFGASRFLSTFIVITGDPVLALLGDPAFLSDANNKQRLFDRLNALTKNAADDKGFSHVMRIFRKQEMLRIGLRDLLGKADLRETVEDLSDLAEVCLQTAYVWVDIGQRRRYGRPVVEQPDGSREPAGFSVIAMGKLGGRELNFSSDVDLMYVYSSDGETEGVMQCRQDHFEQDHEP